jgi:hypothetical protein
MTAVVEVPPNNPGTPPPRPGLRVRARRRTDLRVGGGRPTILRPADTIWEPGATGCTTKAANPGDTWTRFVVVMACKPDQPMLTDVELDERTA